MVTCESTFGEVYLNLYLTGFFLHYQKVNYLILQVARHMYRMPLIFKAD